MAIERLTHLTAALLATPIAESEAHGLHFVRRLADEWLNGVNRFDRPGEALFAVREAADIVAVGGLNIDPYTTDPGTGRVRHLYVVAAHRRRGVGAALVSEIIAAARGRFHTLRLSTSNPGRRAALRAARLPPARRPDQMHARPRGDMTARVRAIAPQFLVDDLETALACYRDQLGFTVDFTYESSYAAVSRDGATVHLKHAAKTLADRVLRNEQEHLDAYLETTGIEALYRELQSRGARIIKPLGVRPWGHQA